MILRLLFVDGALIRLQGYVRYCNKVHILGERKVYT